MNCSGRSVEAASRVIEIDDVFEPTIASDLMCGHNSLKMARLIDSSSVAASMTRSEVLKEGTSLVSQSPKIKEHGNFYILRQYDRPLD